MMDGNGGTGMIMPVAPSGGFGGGMGFGDNGFWIILLFILLGGWNNGGNAYGAGGGGYSRGNNVTDGLRELMYAAPAEMQGEIQRLIKKLDNM